MVLNASGELGVWFWDMVFEPTRVHDGIESISG
jgi:hypothetical protein